MSVCSVNLKLLFIYLFAILQNKLDFIIQPGFLVTMVTLSWLHSPSVPIFMVGSFFVTEFLSQSLKKLS